MLHHTKLQNLRIIKMGYQYSVGHPSWCEKNFVKGFTALSQGRVCLFRDVNRIFRLFLILKKIDKMQMAS